MKNKKKYEKTNLIAEIEKFGYKVSVKSLLGTFASVVAGCIAAGYLFKLKPICLLYTSPSPRDRG